MRNKFLLCNSVFVISLIVLFLNDHVFKLQFHNWITGKLSDFVGIIILPFLLAFVFPKLRQNSVYFAGLVFIFWKSPYSEGLINFYNAISPISIYRIVDFTDLISLFFLVIPYYLIKEKTYIKPFEIKKISPQFIFIPSVFVLMSTSPPRYYDYVPYNGNIIFSSFNIMIKGKTKDEVFLELKKRNIPFYKDTARIISKNRFNLIRSGKIETKNIASKKELFKISQDTLKTNVEKLLEEYNWYIIDSMKLDDEMVKNIQFEIGTYSTRKGSESIVTIKGLNTEKKLTEKGVERKLKKMYRGVLKKEFTSF